MGRAEYRLIVDIVMGVWIWLVGFYLFVNWLELSGLWLMLAGGATFNLSAMAGDLLRAIIEEEKGRGNV